MNLKKLLAIVLVLAMVMSFMPTMAFADDDVIVEEEYAEEPVAEAVDEADEVVDEDVADEPSDVYDEPEEEQLEGEVVGSNVTVNFFPNLAAGEAAAYTATASATSDVTKVAVAAADDAAAKAAVQAKNPGYNQIGWLDENGNRIDVTTAFARPSSGVVNVKAEWGTAKTFTVTFSAASGSPSDITLPKMFETVTYNGSPVVKTAAGADPDLEAQGYDFDGFYATISGTETRIASTLTEMRAYKITEDTNVTLKWKTKSVAYTVEFVYKDAKADSIKTDATWTMKPSTVDTTVATVTISGTETKKIPDGFNKGDGSTGNVMTHKDYDSSKTTAANHYIFDKWTPGGSYTLDGNVTSDETFTATWKLEEFTATFKVDEGTAYAVTKTETVSYGNSAIGFTPVKQTGTHEHEEFVGWTTEKGNKDKIVALASYAIKENTTFYAYWETNTNKVTFELNGGAGSSASQFAAQNVPYGGTVTDPGEPTKFGYHFTGWTSDAAGEQPFSLSTPITAAKTLYAQYAGNKYELWIDTSELGTATTPKYDGADLTNPVATIPVYGGASGTSFAVKATTQDGFTLNGYTYKDNSTAGYKTVAAGTTLALDKTMVFEPGNSANEYKLTLKPVIASQFYVVKFVNKGPDGTALGDVVEQTFETYPTPTTAKKVTTPTMKDGTQLPVGAVYKDLYLKEWTVAGSGAVWDFNDSVTGSMTLVASYVPFWTVTFEKRDDAKWTTTGETGKRLVLNGMTLEQMSALAAKNKALADYLTAKGSINFDAPEATREGYNKLNWVIAGTHTPFYAKTNVPQGEFATIVNENMTVTDSWTKVTVYVEYYANATSVTGASSSDAKLGDVSYDQVDYGTTVAKRNDPIWVNTTNPQAFNGWVYQSYETSTDPYTYNPNEAKPFEFNKTKVTNKGTTYGFNVYATWTDAEAKIGTKYYATIADAIDAADAGATIGIVKDLTLTDTVAVTKNVNFDFSGFTVTGGTFAVASGKTLTVKGGIFADSVFSGSVDLKDGTFLGAKFTGATLTTYGGKYDAAAARAINAEQLKSGDKVLAVAATSSDGYYRCVGKQTLSFVLQPGTQGINVVVGAGETPDHAITEAYNAKTITKEQYGMITKPTAQGKAFKAWTIGTGSEAKTLVLTDAYAGGDAVVNALWANQWKLSFVVGTKEVYEVAYDESSTGTDVSAAGTTGTTKAEDYINTVLNKDKAEKEKDKFECWLDKDGKAFDFSKKVTTNTNITLTAKMKAKVVFDPLNASQALTVLWYNHGDRLAVQSASFPAGSWVNSDGVALNENDFVNGDLNYYAKVVGNDKWQLIDYSPEVGWGFVGTNTYKYEGTEADPIVAAIEGEGTAARVPFVFTVEAPATVKESDKWEIQLDGGAWTVIQPKGTLGATAVWDGTSPNNNMIVKVNESLTVDQIKTAAKAGTTFSFDFSVRPAATTTTPSPAVAATFKVTFNPKNLKLTNYTANPNNASKVLLIKNGAFEYKLTYALAGGVFSDDTKAESTVEYGTTVVLPANPTKTDTTNTYLFEQWTASPVIPTSPFKGGYTDPVDHKYHPEGYTVDGKQYGGTLTSAGKFTKNSFVMNQAVTLTASYTTVSVVVNITDNGYTTQDKSFMLSSTLSDVYAKLPTPKAKDDQIFAEWQYQKAAPADVETNWVTFVADANKTIEQLLTGTGLSDLNLKTKYNKAISMTFKKDADTLVVVKQVAPTVVGASLPASKFYTDEVKTAEASIDLFEYWTLTEPTNGGYAKAPEKYNFSTETVNANVILYAYTKTVPDLTVKIHAAGSTEANEIKVPYGKTIPGEYLPVVKGQNGWCTVDAQGVAAKFDTEAKITANVEIWAAYVVSYSANCTDKINVPADQIKAYSKPLKLYSEEPVREDYEFLGWATSSAAVTAEYQPGDEYTENASVTLYAVWQDSVQKIINTGYEKMLGREPDAEGQAYYEKELKEGRLTGAQMVSNFMNSPEFAELAKDMTNEQIVGVIYETMLGREPSAEEAAFHAKNLEDGYSYNAIINCFSQSPEFLAICEEAGIEAGEAAPMWRDMNLSITAFVKRCYILTLERPADIEGLEFYCEALVMKYNTPQEIAHNFLASPEFQERKLDDEAYIKVLYALFMDREPEAEGLAYYLDLLSTGAATRDQIEANFGASPEFAEICKSFGL